MCHEKLFFVSCPLGQVDVGWPAYGLSRGRLTCLGWGIQNSQTADFQALEWVHESRVQSLTKTIFLLDLVLQNKTCVSSYVHCTLNRLNKGIIAPSLMKNGIENYTLLTHCVMCALNYTYNLHFINLLYYLLSYTITINSLNYV